MYQRRIWATRRGGTSVLFRIYQPVRDYGECQQRRQPLSVRESSYAAHPLALLALSTTTPLPQIATNSPSLYRSCFHLQHLILLLHRSITSFPPFLFPGLSAYIGCLQKCECGIGATLIYKEIGNSEPVAPTLCMYSNFLPQVPFAIGAMLCIP